jgi:hypothetical protein
MDYFALYTAVLNNKKNAFKDALKDPHFNPNRLVMPDQRTFLTLACEFGRREIVCMLLAHPKIDVNAPTAHGNTAFSMSALGNHCEMLEILIRDPRVDIHARNLWGRNAINFAARNSYSDVLTLLLKSTDIDVNSVSVDRPSAIIEACVQGNLEGVELILAFRENVDVEFVCDRSNEAKFGCWWQYEDIMELIQDYRADRKTIRCMLRQKHGAEGEFFFLCFFFLFFITSFIFFFVDTLAANLFTCVVLFSDEFFKIRKVANRFSVRKLDKESRIHREEERVKISNATRFFAIARKIPMEIQMMLCNRVYALSRDLVSSINREISFCRILEELREAEL